MATCLCVWGVVAADGVHGISQLLHVVYGDTTAAWQAPSRLGGGQLAYTLPCSDTSYSTSESTHCKGAGIMHSPWPGLGWDCLGVVNMGAHYSRNGAGLHVWVGGMVVCLHD
jgi:hypothetical protein